MSRADRVITVDGGRVTVATPLQAPLVVVRAAPPVDDAPPVAETPPAPPEGSGAVPSSLYREYLRRLLPTSGLVGLGLLFAAREGFAVGADYWLSWWTGSSAVGPGFVIGLCAFGGAAAVATLAGA